MTNWTAVVPFKPAGERKTRLADQLSAGERGTLSERMFAHVIAVLEDHPKIGSVALLSEQPPENWGGIWVADEGNGLNAGLETARAQLGEVALLVLHADLPLLQTGDLDALIAAAEAHGAAIAPDRHGSGTNALALAPGHQVAFRFGVGSFRLHREQMPGGAVVERPGFAVDLDTPDDLAEAADAGFSLDRWLS